MPPLIISILLKFDCSILILRFNLSLVVSRQYNEPSESIEHNFSSKYIGLVVFFSLPDPENIFFLSVIDDIVFILPRLFFTF